MEFLFLPVVSSDTLLYKNCMHIRTLLLMNQRHFIFPMSLKIVLCRRFKDTRCTMSAILHSYSCEGLSLFGFGAVETTRSCRLVSVIHGADVSFLIFILFVQLKTFGDKLRDNKIGY